MKIDREILKSWGACAEGQRAFARKFPQGAEYSAVQLALQAKGRFEWSRWLAHAAFSAVFKDATQIGPLAADEVAIAQKAVEGSPNTSGGDYSTAASSGDYSTAASSGDSSKAASSGYYSTAASSGYYSTAASSGDYSKAASSGNHSTAASSGDSSKAASSGDFSTAASSGDYSTAASSGDYSKAASSGDSSTAASSGYSSTAASSGDNTIAMVAGYSGRAKTGDNGCLALSWWDGQRPRIVVGYVGEGIKPDTWYKVADGVLTEVT